MLGYAFMGKAHSNAFRKLAYLAWPPPLVPRLVAIAGRNEDAVADAARRYGYERWTTDWHDVVADDAIGLFDNGGPNSLHAEPTIAAAEAEKHVLCEKPLAPTAAASLAVVEAESALGRRLVQVAFMRRYDRGYVAVKERLDAGAIGRPLLVHCAHRNAGVPDSYTTEMLFTSSATHEVDVTRWFLGREIVAATVMSPRSTRLGRDDLRDPQLVVLETDDGVLVDVEVFANAQYGYDIRCEVVGETGTLTLSPPVDVFVRAEGHDGRRINPDFRGRFLPAYRDQLQAWVDAVVAGGPPPGANAWDGYAAATVIDACVASLHAGRRKEVALAARPELYAPTDERTVAAAP
jgi:myo-inositol 2-dehydrogenase/D-chiro-inositol 1-dehydrogenase